MLARAWPGTPEAELDALVGAFRAAYDGGDWRATVPYPGVAALLDAVAAAGGRAFVVTNKPHAPTARILRHLRLAPRFAEVRSPDTPGASWDGKGAVIGELAR